MPVEVTGAPTLTQLVRNGVGDSPGVPGLGVTGLAGIDANGVVYRLRRNENASTRAALFVFENAGFGLPVKTLAESYTHRCAISKTDDRLYCWGTSSSEGNELGTGSRAAGVTSPALVAGQAP